MKFAIIGAGMAGLTCGKRLTELGHDVTLFDKGRGPGGRMATRRVETEQGTAVFDHGAQFFRAIGLPFAAQVNKWIQGGHVATWPALGRDAYVGKPGMNAPLKAMAEELTVHWATRVDAITRDGDGWTLKGENVGAGNHYDAAIIAVPAEQAGPLLQAHDPAMTRTAIAVRSQPCWTVMAAFSKRLDIQGDILRDTLSDAGALAWAARNSSKPGRSGPDSWLIQADDDWSLMNLERSEEIVIEELMAEFENAAQFKLPEALSITAHRWRYSQPVNASKTGHLWDARTGLGACGDWLCGPKIEDAWTSGMSLAKTIGAA